MNATNTARRNLLRFLAASPLVAAPSVASSIAALFASTPNEALAQSYDVLRGAAQKLDADGVINSPAQALYVFDFELAAKKALADAPAHFGYLASGFDRRSHLGVRPDRPNAATVIPHHSTLTHRGFHDS